MVVIQDKQRSYIGYLRFCTRSYILSSFKSDLASSIFALETILGYLELFKVKFFSAVHRPKLLFATDEDFHCARQYCLYNVYSYE